MEVIMKKLLLFLTIAVSATGFANAMDQRVDLSTIDRETFFKSLEEKNKAENMF
jgi:hypothetical protein